MPITYYLICLKKKRNKTMKNSINRTIILFLFLLFLGIQLNGQANDSIIFPIYGLSLKDTPKIDGDFSDWDIVPDSFIIGINELTEDEGKHQFPDKSTLDVKIKVAWVEGENRLYFLYEAYDNYWSFSRNDLMVDIFEVVVDGDRSGGPFIDRFYPFKDVSKEEAWDLFHGRHAQNYHIYTPHKQGDWCMYWGPQQWLKEKPFSDYAYAYDFEEGDSGKLSLEFYITPFDYASPKGPNHSIESVFYSGKRIGLCWAIIDYDNNEGKPKDGFWNLSREHTMYGNATYLRTFELKSPK